MIKYNPSQIESILTTNMLVWFECTNKREIKKIESIVRTAEIINTTSLRTIQSIYQERAFKRTWHFIKDLSHPAIRYFQYFRLTDYVHSATTRDSLIVFGLLQSKHSILIVCVNQQFIYLFSSHVYNIVHTTCTTLLFICLFLC